ncbi:DUF559 domain-containing protein [Mycolicibacterium sp. P1-18]|uniref:DUF559 domain-containing protein n=1 Tax=Mycolicibacterium sp. P1-18 TaxID=2024615 RepID=UPI0011F2CD16|nr:DUF559 domain-containing protein [Mycolicibacterium sp. P1-18]KAA0097641.1 DUF559 domain-containing protein [Mycolicibacterium sp. P1-18]
MAAVFSGSRAVSRGRLTRHRLRTRFEAIHPDVYVAEFAELTIADRARAAVLWSKGRGVVAGVTASALHGAKWVDDDEAVELIWRNQHAPRGVVTRNERVESDEIVVVDGISVTTTARTALDLGRHLGRDAAVTRLDALAHATGISAADVEPLLIRHRGSRGVRKARDAIALMDAGGTSPKETWLRLLVLDAGLPKPKCQLMVHNGDYYPLAYLDLGWDEYMVAVEYDGDQHRTDRQQYRKDVSRLQMLERMGWIVIRVLAGEHPMDVLQRIRHALARRNCREA